MSEKNSRLDYIWCFQVLYRWYFYSNQLIIEIINIGMQQCWANLIGRNLKNLKNYQSDRNKSNAKFICNNFNKKIKQKIIYKIIVLIQI